MSQTAVAAPAKPPSDACNWLPLGALRRTHTSEGMCLHPCIQHFDMTVAGQKVRIHRCVKHKLADPFVSKLKGPVDR